MKKHNTDDRIDDLLDGWLGKAKGFTPSDSSLPAEAKTKHITRATAKAQLNDLLREAKVDLLRHLATSDPKYTHAALLDILIDLREDSKLDKVMNRDEWQEPLDKLRVR